MRKAIQDLLDLQAEDIRLRNLQIRYKTIPGERAKIVAEFETVRSAFEAEKQKLLKLNQEVKSCEAEITAMQEKQRALEIKSGTIKKQAEYDASMAEIAKAKMKISDLETQALELMDQVDAQQQVVAKSERNYKATGRLAQGEVRELDALKEQILKEAREKAQLSKLKEKNVQQTLLAQYKRILAGGKGLPLSKIDGGLCSNCMMKLPPMTLTQAAKGEVVNCDNCSYMLYDPNAKDE